MKKRRVISAASDFTIEQLPQTRRSQFFNILKNQYLTILKSGAFLLLAVLPFIVLDLVRNIFDTAFYNEFVNGILQEGEYHFYIFIDLMIQTAVEVLFIPVFTLVLSGINNVMKNMVQGGHVLFMYDFKQGVKGNYKNTTITSIIFGLFILLARFVFYFFVGKYFISIPVYAILILFVIPLAIISNVFTSYYQGNFFNVVSNSTKLYFPYWWQYLIVSVLFFAFIFGLNSGLDGVLIAYVKTTIYLVFATFVLPIMILLIHSISISMFDKYINDVIYPEIYRKGLYNPKTPRTNVPKR